MSKDTNSKEGKEVKLRCIIKRKSSGYVGVCLEFSLAVKAATPEKCKEELSQSIEEYIETIKLLNEQHKRVGVRPVEYYLFKKVLFDVRYLLHSLHKKDDFTAGFVKRALVPVGT